jgi:hypothetical protein
MGRILDYIAHETNGKCFTSFKYCYDDSAAPNIEYGSSQEDSYINMKEYAESIHDPNVRDMRMIAQMAMQGPPLFKFFLDGSRRVYKVDDIQYDKKVFPIVSGQISVACCGREMNTDNTFKQFYKVVEEAYPVVCLPITANEEGIDNGVYFNKSVDKYINLTNRLLRRFYRGFSNDLENVRNSLLCVIILSNNPCQKQR